MNLLNFRWYEVKEEGKWIPYIRRDWAIIVCSFFFAIIFFIVLHSFFYFKMMSDNYFYREDASMNNTLNTVQKKDLDRVISSFEAKKKRFDEIINSPVPYEVSSHPGISILPKKVITATSSDGSVY